MCGEREREREREVLLFAEVEDNNFLFSEKIFNVFHLERFLFEIYRISLNAHTYMLTHTHSHNSNIILSKMERLSTTTAECVCTYYSLRMVCDCASIRFPSSI